jgi:hypothetical protein
LVRWIAEAAIGLDRPEAIVNCSFREQIDADMLRSGERLVKETTGRDVSLHFGGAILTGQALDRGIGECGLVCRYDRPRPADYQQYVG